MNKLTINNFISLYLPVAYNLINHTISSIATLNLLSKVLGFVKLREFESTPHRWPTTDRNHSYP